ncbi:hypothetical protein NA56DRAFT_703659 [Hyaloscypha hepaticicola]|uniref:DUF6594 domain-containing protein n=1 Tax=Hyaloscypha hepaticicola TaxID=2082293 RepID=A0A2J6Q5L8_9HELO|nr:hypothetical protein NA56DRAFT_703659 [Hyaloscypha hepaticicola]
MPSEETGFPVPIAASSSYATNYNKAERALQNPQPAICRASLRSSCSNGAYAAEVPPETMSYTDRMRSIFRFLSAVTMTYISHLSGKISTHYASNGTENEQQEDSIKVLYKKFKNEPIDSYPPGWPQLAAFMHSEDNFAIFRRFGLVHCRVLVQLQAEIQLLEKKLSALDQSDASPGSPNAWRLQTSEFKEGWDAEKKDLVAELLDKLLNYDALLLNDQKLRELGNAPRKDHLSVFHWIMARKPLGKNQYDWIYSLDDFISLSKPDPFKSSVLASCLKWFFKNRDKTSKNSIVERYSDTKLSVFAKMSTILLAVGILIIPVFIFLWFPKTQACISATVLISVLVFSTLISLFTKARAQEVLVGTAAYCAVLVAFLGNIVSIPGENIST